MDVVEERAYHSHTQTHTHTHTLGDSSFHLPVPPSLPNIIFVAESCNLANMDGIPTLLRRDGTISR